MVTETLKAQAQEELTQKIQRYKRNYHPQGYGTNVGSVDLMGDVWIAKMRRYESCD